MPRPPKTPPLRYAVVGAAALLLSTPSEALAQRTVDLMGDTTYPEGIAAHASTGELFVGGLGDGSIQRIWDGKVSYFKTAHQDGLMNVIGMTVDAARNRLWVCSTNFMDVFTGDGPTMPEMVVFDTESGQVLGRFAVPDDGRPHFFNDVTVDADGNAYITDSLAPVIWRVDGDLGQLIPWVQDAESFQIQQGFNLNGIVITPDQRYAITVIPMLDGGPGRLFRIGLDDGNVQPIEVPGFPGADGLAFGAGAQLYAVGQRLARVDLDPTFTKGEVHVFSVDRWGLDFPTTGAVLDDAIWVTNSQLDHLVPIFANTEPPMLPFHVTEIPLQEIR